MSTLEDLDDLEREEKEKKDEGGDDKDKGSKKDGDAKADGKDVEMKDVDEPSEEDELDEEILNLSTRDINTRRRLLENELRIMKSEFSRLTHEKATMQEKIKDNVDKIENNRYGPPCLLVNADSAQTATVSGWKCGRNSRSRRHGRGG
jgi:26S proteasome regulatory subunit T5